MKKILLLNGRKKFGHSEGRLSKELTDLAAAVLEKSGHDLRRTEISEGYENEEEVEKILWADALIWQAPAWWMDVPWTVKRYVDEVFTAGFGKFWKNDGRTRADPSRPYGSGGLLKGKRYMLSVTWNAPEKAFTDPQEFFGGQGVDAVYLPFHKAQQFLGLSPLPTFMINDVIKDPQIETDLARYRAHLDKAFPAV